ncbi:MAG: hypothetical protein RIS94_283 [Pseudomonadota bacterium]|jgi:hypothetical protein
MKITSYGLFWRTEEIEWAPGGGNRDSFRLLGRVGKNKPTIKIADFRFQTGIYILYDDYGAYYVGLSRAGLGKRLKDHTKDDHADKWDRFSWFGFRPIADADRIGIRQLSSINEEITENAHATIGDLEALLIKAMGPKANSANMNLKDAAEWKQIEWESIEHYLAKVAPDGAARPIVGKRANIMD